MSELFGELLRALDVRPHYCVGHSAGAVVLCRLALDGRISPRCIVGINGAFLPLRGAARFLFSPIAQLLARSSVLPRLIACRGGNAGSVARVIEGTGSQLDPAGIDLYMRLVRDPAHIAGTLAMLGHWDLHAFEKELPRLATPLTLLVGENDRAVPPAQALTVQRRVVQVDVTRLPGLGHLAHEEQPARVAQEIAKYAVALDALRDLDFSRMHLSTGIDAPRQHLPHAIVIGSGFGGLAAAIRLGARGYRVTVFEQLDAPGGRAYVFRQDGFVFDAGPTIITAPFLLEDLWRLCDRHFEDDVELSAMQPFYRIRFHDGAILDCSADDQAMAEQIDRIAPGDFPGYQRFLEASEAIYRVAFEQLAHAPFDSLADMLRLVPALVRLRGYRSVYGLAASFVKNPRLRFALSFHPLFVGGNPFTTTSIYGLIAFLERRWGVHCVMGGTGALVNGMAKLIEGQGNRIRYHARVNGITTTGRRATGIRLSRARRSHPTSWCRTPIPPRPIATCFRRICAGVGPSANSARGLLDELVRLVFRHLEAVS